MTNDKVVDKKRKRISLNEIHQRKFRYFGHIKRKNEILKIAIEGILESKRPRVRPGNNWVTNTKEWTGLPARVHARGKLLTGAFEVSILVDQYRGDDTPK